MCASWANPRKAKNTAKRKGNAIRVNAILARKNAILTRLRFRVSRDSYRTKYNDLRKQLATEQGDDARRRGLVPALQRCIGQHGEQQTRRPTQTVTRTQSRATDEPKLCSRHHADG